MGLFNIMNELFRAQMENLGSDPTPGLPGRFFFRSDTKKFRGDNGTQIVDLGGGGGGLGSSVIWMPDQVGTAPAETIENNQKVFIFGAGLTEKIFSLVKVPDSYAAGLQIKMRILAYSPSTSNDFLLQSVTTLIRRNTDPTSSTTNQRTSTNSAQTNGTANVLREIELDLTSSTGQVNSVAVAARDLLLVQLSRGTDTDTDDVRFLPIATEVLFS